jgi:hypothetical protein
MACHQEVFVIRKLTVEKNWFIDWIEEWSQFFRDDNWYTFHPCWIEFENDKIMGGYEFTFVLLGCGMRWRWNHTSTPQMQDCLDAVEDIKAGTVHTRAWGEVKEWPKIPDDDDVVH